MGQPSAPNPLADWTDREIEARWPMIPWRRALHVTVPGRGQGWLCRLCAARYGFRGRDVGTLPQTMAAWQEHMAREHPM